MAYDLDQFVSDCRAILQRDGGPKGREQVRLKLEQLLGNRDFVETYCGDQVPRGLKVPPAARACRHLPGRQDPFDRLSRLRAFRARHRHQSRQDRARALRSCLGQGGADDAAAGDVRAGQCTIDQTSAPRNRCVPSPACGGGLGRGHAKRFAPAHPIPTPPP